MATLKSQRPKIVVPTLSTGVNTLEPNEVLYQTLYEYYNETIFPSELLWARVREALLSVYGLWHRGAQEADVSLERWLRNHIAQTPAEGLDAVRRMLLCVVHESEYSAEELVLAGRLAALLPTSALAAELLDIAASKPVAPLALASLFACFESVPALIADALRLAPIQNDERKLCESLTAIFDEISPVLHVRMAKILISHWGDIGLPPFTLASFSQAPVALRDALLTSLRLVLEGGDDEIGSAHALEQALPPEELELLIRLREPVIGSEEEALLENPDYRLIVHEVLQRLSRSAGTPPSNKLLRLSWLRLLDTTTPRGVQELLQLPPKEGAGLLRRMQIKRQAEILTVYCKRSSPTEVEVLVQLLISQSLRETLAELLSTGMLPVWRAFLTFCPTQQLWQELTVKSPSRSLINSVVYGDREWVAFLMNVLRNPALTEILRTRLAEAVRTAGDTTEQREAYLAKHLNLGNCDWLNEEMRIAIYVVGLVGAEGERFLLPRLKRCFDARRDQEIWETVCGARWSWETILSEGMSLTSLALEVILPRLTDQEIQKYSLQFEAVVQGASWSHLAWQHRLDETLKGKLLVLGRCVPSVGSRLFLAAPIRFVEFAQEALTLDLLPHVGQHIEILRAFSNRVLTDEERVKTWESAHGIYARTAIGVALELGLTFGQNLIPRFTVFAFETWQRLRREVRQKREFADPGTVFDARYHSWLLPKKSGGNRTITAPDTNLKYLQKWMLRGGFDRLNTQEWLGESVHGFVPGRGILSNAQRHVGQELVVNVDIAAFFPSISYARIMKAVMQLNNLPDIKLSGAALHLIADICSYQGALPTGAPTSPAIANLVLHGLDRSLETLCAKKGVTYSRYADDLTFSGSSEAKTLIPFVEKCLEQLGLKLDPKKINLFRRGRRQVVTGLVVNEKPNLPRRLRRRLRAAVHQRTFGKEVCWHDRPMTDAELNGRIAFLKLVQPDEAARLKGKLKEARDEKEARDAH